MDSLYTFKSLQNNIWNTAAAFETPCIIIESHIEMWLFQQNSVYFATLLQQKLLYIFSE
jgi:hypothetical protein